MFSLSYKQYLILKKLVNVDKSSLNIDKKDLSFLLNNNLIKADVNEVTDPEGYTKETPNGLYSLTKEGLDAFYIYKYNRTPRFLSFCSIIISIFALLISFFSYLKK